MGTVETGKPVNIDMLVDQITRTDDAERNKLFKYAATLPDVSRRKAMAAATDFFYASRAKWPGTSKVLLFYSGFVIALKDFHYAKHMAVKRKDTEKHVGMMEGLLDDKFKSIVHRRRSGLKKNKICVYLAEIKEARRKNMSFQGIADWLLEEHRLKVSKEYVRRIINENN